MAKTQEDFIVAMEAEGVPPDVARMVMRLARTCYRLHVAEVNGEWPYRDGAGRQRTPFPDPYDRAFKQIRLAVEPYRIAPEVSALDVRLRCPSGRDDGWGGVFVPRGNGRGIA